MTTSMIMLFKKKRRRETTSASQNQASLPTKPAQSPCTFLCSSPPPTKNRQKILPTFLAECVLTRIHQFGDPRATSSSRSVHRQRRGVFCARFLASSGPPFFNARSSSPSGEKTLATAALERTSYRRMLPEANLGCAQFTFSSAPLGNSGTRQPPARDLEVLGCICMAGEGMGGRVWARSWVKCFPYNPWRQPRKLGVISRVECAVKRCTSPAPSRWCVVGARRVNKRMIG